MTILDFMWLVGLLEGEGTFLCGPPSDPYQPRIRLQMTDEDVVQRVGQLFNIRPQKSSDSRNPKWKPCWSFSLKGSRAVALMSLIHPFMGNRRRAQIERAVKTYKFTVRHGLSQADIERIKKIQG